MISRVKRLTFCFKKVFEFLSAEMPFISKSMTRSICWLRLTYPSTFVLRIPQGTIMKIRSMQTCIMSSLPHCIFRCSVFRYVTLVSFVFLFKLCYLIVTLLLWWRINTYLLTYLRLDWLKTRIMVMERAWRAEFERTNWNGWFWNASASGLNYTKKRQSLHPTKNLHDVLTLLWLCSKRMQRKDSHICFPLVGSL